MQLLALPAFIYAFWKIKALWWSLPQSPSDNYSQESKIKIIFFCFGLLVFYVYQIFFPLFQIDNFFYSFTVSLGYLCLYLGFWLCKMALEALGNNWSSLLEYQVKKGQKLITTGIYKYFRHPLYLGDILWLTGLELVLNSWLFIPLSILIFLLFKIHSRQEDKLLSDNFKEWLGYHPKINI